MKINLDDIERTCREWQGQLGKPWIEDDERIHLDGNVMLALVAIVRAAKAVRDARRQGLRGDHPQDLHDSLSRALDAAGLGMSEGDEPDSNPGIRVFTDARKNERGTR